MGWDTRMGWALAQMFQQKNHKLLKTDIMNGMMVSHVNVKELWKSKYIIGRM